MQAEKYTDKHGMEWNRIGNILYAPVSYETTGHICAPDAGCLMCDEPTGRVELHVHVRHMDDRRDRGLCSEGCLIQYLREKGVA